MKILKQRYLALLLTIVVINNTSAQTPIQSEFTYQGELTFNEQAADGLYDFEISAHDALTNGNQTASPLTIEAVEVTAGIFTLNLDFGDAAFVGDEVYLEIHVRENNSGSPFSELSPRQKLTNTPYAIHAQFVGADAITSDEISDGSISTSDLQNNSITSAKINNNAVGTDAIDSSEVQRRVNGDCSVGSYIRSINQDGTVVCETDETGNSQVTSAEIVDGTIMAVDIAANVIGTSEVNSAQVQTRISGSCTYPEYLSGIDQNGNVNCQRVPQGVDFSITTSSLIDRHSMAIGSDGLPIISYYDEIDGNLHIVKCTTQYCSGFNTPVTLDSEGNVGQYNSLVIGADNLPIISYFDTTDKDLKLIKCISNDCTDFNLPLTLDFTGDVGRFNLIAIGADSFPIISYYDETNGNLKFIKCTNHSCSNSNPPITLDSADDVGLTSSIAIGTDGLPVISYYDSTNGNLKLIKCTNINCNGANNPIILDDAESVGTFSSIAIGTNDLPIISYRDLLNQNLKVVNCTNVSCSNSSAPITINSEGNVGAVDSMIIGSDGRPIISYIDSDSSALKIAKCLSRDCFFTVIFSTLDSLIIPGYFTSIGLSNDGLPVISYVERSKGAIKVYSCADVDCKK